MIIAIDPGPSNSAMVVLDGLRIHYKVYADNRDILEYLANTYVVGSDCVIEMIASYGMAVGAEVFETCYWIGRFAQAYRGQVSRVPRLKIKQHLCHDSRAKDANIRQAIVDRFGGKDKAIGTKKAPGPLYGVSGDCWSALAVALWAHDTQAYRTAVGGAA